MIRKHFSGLPKIGSDKNGGLSVAKPWSHEKFGVKTSTQRKDIILYSSKYRYKESYAQYDEWLRNNSSIKFVQKTLKKDIFGVFLNAI